MPFEPKAGQFLHASCSNEDVYEILRVGVDANGAPVLDLKVLSLVDMIHPQWDHEDEDLPEFSCSLMRAELPEGVHLVLRNVGWKRVDIGPVGDGPELINVNGPQGGCYRCCYLFGVYDGPGGERPVKG